MLVAVPLFGQDVAPRFGFADSFLVGEISDKQFLGDKVVQIPPGCWPDRLGELKDLGVEVLLCGGFNRAFIPLAEDFGIEVLAGFTGDARRLAEAFARGEAIPTFPCPGMALGKRSGRGCDGVGGRGRKRGGNNRLR
jgi:predicted Fe-Mo cluster-binding NifX family protein